MSITLNGDSGITSPTYGGTVSAEYNVPVTAFKNRIINGAMQIDQRNAGASVTIPATTSTYVVDRFYGFAAAASKFTLQQNAGSVTVPAGFNNYLGATVGASAGVTVGATDLYGILQAVEGLNVSDLAWGTANAQTVTLSFKVYSSLTGTFGGSILNSAQDRSYPFNYTVSSANTWTTVSITIAGDTSGTWLKTNGVGLYVVFGLGVGSTRSTTANSWAAGTYYSATSAVKVIETNSATFYITGVQLEKGSTATSFDYRTYGTELSLCQRYYFTNGPQVSTPATYTNLYFPVTMRVSPTISGGNAGFTVTIPGTLVNVVSQTTAAAVALTYSAEL